MSEIVLTQENFEEEVLKSEKPVLVDLWAPWCYPCLALAPTVSEIAEEFEGKIKVGKLNIGEAPGITARYKIMSIPTLIIFKDGKDVFRFVGVQPKEVIVDKIKGFL